MVLRLGQRGLRGGGGGLGRSQRVLFVLRLEAGDDLSGFDPVALPQIVLDEAAGNAEGEVDLVLRFDPPGHRDRRSGLALFDGDGAHGPWRRGGGFFLLRAGAERQRRQQIIARHDALMAPVGNAIRSSKETPKPEAANPLS